MGRTVPKRRVAVDVSGGGSAEPEDHEAVEAGGAAEDGKLDELARKRIKQLVGRAYRVVDLVLRVEEKASEAGDVVRERIESNPAAWKLRSDLAMKVLSLACSMGRSGTTKKALKHDAEGQPEDDQGVLDGAFAHLR